MVKVRVVINLGENIYSSKLRVYSLVLYIGIETLIYKRKVTM